MPVPVEHLSDVYKLLAALSKERGSEAVPLQQEKTQPQTLEPSEAKFDLAPEEERLRSEREVSERFDALAGRARKEMPDRDVVKAMLELLDQEPEQPRREPRWTRSMLEELWNRQKRPRKAILSAMAERAGHWVTADDLATALRAINQDATAAHVGGTLSGLRKQLRPWHYPDLPFEAVRDPDTRRWRYRMNESIGSVVRELAEAEHGH